MSCKPGCVCKCGHSGCECWDGIRFTKRDEAELRNVGLLESTPKTARETDKS